MRESSWWNPFIVCGAGSFFSLLLIVLFASIYIFTGDNLYQLIEIGFGFLSIAFLFLGIIWLALLDFLDSQKRKKKLKEKIKS